MPRIRLGDKFSRFKTLSRILSSDSDQQAVTDESIRDTLLDLANYSIMTVLEIDDAQHEQEIAEQKTCDDGALCPFHKGLPQARRWHTNYYTWSQSSCTPGILRNNSAMSSAFLQAIKVSR